MILVEGMDNSGKSTLCKKICEEFSLQMLERTPPPTGPYWEARKYGLKQLNHGLGPKVSDRCYAISEWVYGPVVRGGIASAHGHSSIVERLLYSQHLLIYCRPPTEKIMDFGDRPQMEGVKELSSALLERYDWFFKNLSSANLPFLLYDWTKGEEEWRTVRRIVADYLEFESSVDWFLDKLEEGV